MITYNQSLDIMITYNQSLDIMITYNQSLVKMSVNKPLHNSDPMKVVE